MNRDRLRAIYAAADPASRKRMLWRWPLWFLAPELANELRHYDEITEARRELEKEDSR